MPAARLLRALLRRAWPGVSVVVVAAMALATGSMRGDSATDDEPAHIAAGYVELARGDLSPFPYHPPLASSLAAAPLLAAPVRLPADWATAPNPWNLGHELLYHGGNDADRLLRLARVPTLLLLAGLGALAAWWCFTLTRSVPATLAVCVLVELCPNLLAHGHLATLDLPLTVFVFLAVLALLRWLHAPSLLRAAAASVAVSAALLTKISALALLPWLAAMLAVQLVRGRRGGSNGRLLAGGVVLAALVIAEIELFYLALMRSWWLRIAYPRLAGSLLGRLTIPMREYLHTCALVRSLMAEGFAKPQYLLGEFSTHGWWYYYPVAFLLKTTLPALLLVLVAAAARVVVRGNPSAEAPRPWLDELGIALFVVIYLAAAMSGSLAFGLRHVLPIYPFVYLLAAVWIAEAAAAAGKRDRATLWAVATALLVWHAREAVAAYPGYIGYFNQLVGDRAHADRYLIDSNLDWGQDLGRLVRWVDAHHVTQIDVDYFGGGDVRYYLGDRARVLAGPDPRARRPGYVAVSKQYERTSTLERPFGIDYEQYLAGATHVTTVGSSIDVWWIPPPSR